MARRVLTVGAAVLAAALLVGAGCSGNGKASSPAATSTSTTTQVVAGGSSLPAGFVEFRDEAAGFAIAYPSAWNRLESSDRQVPIIVARNQADSFLARVYTLESPVGPQDLPTFQTLTDELVKASDGAEILQGPKAVDVAGLSGFFYFYRFTDGATGARGVHSHYFLVQDRTMFSLVFQALPEASFKELAPVFDQIVSTFRRL